MLKHSATTELLAVVKYVIGLLMLVRILKLVKMGKIC
jgi:hypothetical protein